MQISMFLELLKYRSDSFPYRNVLYAKITHTNLKLVTNTFVSFDFIYFKQN